MTAPQKLTLQNNRARCQILPVGAELASFQLDGVDYLWTRDAQYWASSAPVLFPIVCALNEGKARFGGKEYAIGNHGFVRKMEFELVSSSATSAVFRHRWNDETLAMYPFRYELTVGYTLVGNTLTTAYTVTNAGTENMPFQIGTHPGFFCPLGGEGTLEDWQLEFDAPETFERHYLSAANTLVTGKTQDLGTGRVLPLSQGLLADGAVVFKKVNSRTFTLKSAKSSRQVQMIAKNFPALGIWQPKGAPFVCVEPWHGLADDDTFNKAFEEKAFVVTLKPSESFSCSLTLSLS